MAKRSVTILDHRINNLESIMNAFEALDVEVCVANHPDEIGQGGHLVLPGVGSFGASMEQLHETGLADALVQHVRRGDPLLGICLGYQVLFTTGTEGGEQPALDIIDGRVERFDNDLPVPHVGWNQSKFQIDHPVMKGFSDASYFYFVHSYRTVNVPDDNVLGVCNYGESFVCAAHKDNVVGTQFHPELSGADGLRLLLNFVDWSP